MKIFGHIKTRIRRLLRQELLCCPYCKHPGGAGGPGFTKVEEVGNVIFYRCLFCGKRVESIPKKLSNWYWMFDLYCSLGESYISIINGAINAMGGLGVAWLIIFGFSALDKVWILFVIWAGQKALVFTLGHRDYNKYRMAQRKSVFLLKFNPAAIEDLTRQKNNELATLLVYKKLYNIKLTEVEKKLKPTDFNPKSVLDWYKKQ